jgi:hypothetical protein
MLFREQRCLDAGKVQISCTLLAVTVAAVLPSLAGAHATATDAVAVECARRDGIALGAAEVRTRSARI